MGMSNAERQKRHRQKMKEALRNASSPAVRSLPEIIADLPQSEDRGNSLRDIGSDMLAELKPQVIDYIETLLDDYPVQAREIATIFGIDPDPVRGLTWRQFREAFEAASLSKAALRETLGREARALIDHMKLEDRAIWLSEAHRYRPLLQRLGLWSVT